MDPAEDQLPHTGGPRVAPAGHQVPVPQVQQLLPEKETSEGHVHHSLQVWFSTSAVRGGTHKTVPQENVQPSMFDSGKPHQQPSDPHAVEGQHGPIVRPKAERSNMQELWQVVSSHSSVYSKLFSFGVRSLRSRECSLYEASHLLLGDHLLASPRPSSGSMCHGHSRGKGDSSITPSSWK